MSTATQIEAELLALIPEFREPWEELLKLWANDEGRFTTHGIFSAFSSFVGDRLVQGQYPTLAAVFEYAESKLNGTDSEVDNAVATCFLENLMNQTPEQISPASFVPLLGPKSRAFCRAYDEWCGMQTEGLHPGKADN